MDRGQGYNKLLTPISQHTSGLLEVNVTIDIENILVIDEVEGTFLVKFSIKRDWIDSALTYHNLKNNSHDLNALTDADTESLWYPSVDINNIENEKKIQRTAINQVQLVVPNTNYI